jgi:Siphovirus Gp157
MRLYDIAAEIRRLFDAGNESGEVSQDTFDLFSKLNLELDAKVNAICGLIKEWSAEADAATTESKRLAELARVRCRRADSMKDYLMQCLDRLNETRHETSLFKTWIQDNPVSLIPTVEPEELPKKFQRVKIDADVQAAKKELEETGNVPEGFEQKFGRHLRIK